MNPRFRLVFLFALCFTLLLSGCSVLEKQSLPYQPQNEVSMWLNSLTGLTPEEQGKKADAMRKNVKASLALRDKALSIAAARPGSQGFSARTDLNKLYELSSPIQRPVLGRSRHHGSQFHEGPCGQDLS